MPGPGEGAAAGRGQLRAAHADREHVIALLKAAFVQGRLTKEEFDARVGQTLASRTYADLAALTADIQAGPVTAEPAGGPARTMVKAACRSAVCMLVAVALAEGGLLANSFGLIILAFMAVMAASGFFGYGVIDSWQERRARTQPRQRSGRGGQGFEGRRPGRTGHDPALPGTRTDQGRAHQGRAHQGRAHQGRADQGRAGQTRAGQGRADQGRADLRADRSGQDRPQPTTRRARAPRTIRPVTGTA